MASIKVLAGDFIKGEGTVGYESLTLITKEHPSTGEAISFTELQTVEVATEENVKSTGGTLGWGAVGALALGPVGLLAGLLLGGNNKEITFIAKFKDGRKIMATTDSETYTRLAAAAF